MEARSQSAAHPNEMNFIFNLNAFSWKAMQPLAKIAVGLVRLDYSAEVVQHADLCLVRARERTVLRVRDRVTDRVWPCIPDRAISKPIAD
jgi:hypothetical protein